MMRRRPALTVLLLAALLLVPVHRNQYHIDVLVMAGIYALLALGLNVVAGSAGLLHLGYAAFYAIGAYSYALLNHYCGWPFWAALPAAAALGGIGGIVLGIPSLRLRGDYLAIVTLGFGEIARITLRNLAVTGGPNGIDGVAHPAWLVRDGAGGLTVGNFGLASWPYYYLVLVLVGIGWYACRLLERSRLGRAWVAIREDEVAAAAMGIDTTRVKLTALGIGGIFAGVAGCVFAGKQGFVSPGSFGFETSVIVLAMVVLGGLGSITGAVLGALILTLVPALLNELPSQFATSRMLFFGIAMILMMLFRPQGILGRPERRRELRPSTEKVREQEDQALEPGRRAD